MKFLKAYLLICLIMISCSNKMKVEDYLLNDLNLDIKKTNQIYIIFSNSSCQTCLSRTKKQIQNWLDADHGNSNMTLVVSGFSKRNIKLFLGDRIVENFEVIYDIDQKLLSRNFYEKGYFYVLEYEDEKVTDYYKYDLLENPKKLMKTLNQ